MDKPHPVLSEDNLDNAITYLKTVKFLGETDCRYYYYLGLVLKHKGLTAEAKENFEYSLKLNPEFELSKKELNI